MPTTAADYAELVAWAQGFGALDRVGVEGSGSFGVGLVRILRARRVVVVEVTRPNRQHRRRSESTIQPMPRRPPERCRSTQPPASLRPPTAFWR